MRGLQCDRLSDRLPSAWLFSRCSPEFQKFEFLPIARTASSCPPSMEAAVQTSRALSASSMEGAAAMAKPLHGYQNAIERTNSGLVSSCSTLYAVAIGRERQVRVNEQLMLMSVQYFLTNICAMLCILFLKQNWVAAQTHLRGANRRTAALGG
jgi:hypothetical protein